MLSPLPRVMASVTRRCAHIPGSLTVSCTRPTTSSLLSISKSPSLPITRNSSPGARSTVMTSGSAVSPSFLRSPSPRERVTCIPTAPMRQLSTFHSTTPPAAWMRARSSGLSALWSRLRATGLPPRHSTARQSPALATAMRLPYTSAATAVQPGYLGGPAAPPIRATLALCSASMPPRKAASTPTKARPSTSSIAAAAQCAPTCAAMCALAKSAVSLPRWPSNTPNRCALGSPPNSGASRLVSSIRSAPRLPHVSNTPARTAGAYTPSPAAPAPHAGAASEPSAAPPLAMDATSPAGAASSTAGPERILPSPPPPPAVMMPSRAASTSTPVGLCSGSTLQHLSMSAQ
mmetsp:Transcript_12745/g.40292  ORF Transcript_12745/g.40292 Transcript_12745/m.40292 type:complete len:347 (-) Transcript_12745:912-1952(-)